MISCNNKLIKQYNTKHMLIGENNGGHLGSMGATQAAEWEIEVIHTHTYILAKKLNAIYQHKTLVKRGRLFLKG